MDLPPDFRKVTRRWFWQQKTAGKTKSQGQMWKHLFQGTSLQTDKLKHLHILDHPVLYSFSNEMKFKAKNKKLSAVEAQRHFKRQLHVSQPKTRGRGVTLPRVPTIDWAPSCKQDMGQVVTMTELVVKDPVSTLKQLTL